MNFENIISSAKASGGDLLNSLYGKKDKLLGQVRGFRNSRADIRDILATAKLNEILRKDEEEEELKKKSPVITILAVIGAIAAVACIAFAVYKYFTPDYLEDFDDGDDFDDEDDLFEDEDEVVAD